ncbi:MAG: alpha/beta fold hydrolase [Oscillospiraceae bacterium]|nr:alpha/beta fold hydrolase [Oscillospiraceae bacterium]
MHSPYIKEQPNARQAVLMIHGICGSPRRFDWLIPHFDDSWSIYNILLDGHGSDPKAFAQTSMKKWKAQVHETLQDLSKRYDRILLMGYSMGTLLAIEALPCYPKIYALMLFNVPLRPHVRLKMIPRSLRLSRGSPNLDDPHEAINAKETGIALTPGILPYIRWIPRFWELLRLSSYCRKHTQDIHIPCNVYLGKEDELVSMQSKKYLRDLPTVTLRIFETAGHYYIAPEDQQTILHDLQSHMA